MTAIKEDRLYTVREAAGMLDVNPSTIWRWIQAEKLTAYRIGTRTIRLKKADLDAMMRPAQPAVQKIPPTPSSRPRPTQEELDRRQALVFQILERRGQRVIAPRSSADLVRTAREQHQAAL